MARDFIFDTFEVQGAITQGRLAAGMINTNKDTWFSQGEVSAALEAFAKEYIALQKVIADYQALLNKDLDAMSKVQQEVILTDLKLTRLWK